MRDLVFVCVVVLVAVCGILLWQARPTANHSEQIESASRQAYLRAHEDPPPAPKPLHATRLVAPPPVAPPVPEVPIEGAVPPSVIVRPPFPSANEITLGLHEDAVTMAYGNPAVSAVTSANGHIVETLVYARERERMATVIRLVDGRVSAAYSKAPPFSAGGLLVRPPGSLD